MLGFLFQFLSSHDERTAFFPPNSCLLAGFHKYPEVIFGDGGGAPPGPRLEGRWAGRRGTTEQAEERSGTLKERSGGVCVCVCVCDEMRCEVFPHSARRRVKDSSSW